MDHALPRKCRGRQNQLAGARPWQKAQQRPAAPGAREHEIGDAPVHAGEEGRDHGTRVSRWLDRRQSCNVTVAGPCPGCGRGGSRRAGQTPALRRTRDSAGTATNVSETGSRRSSASIGSPTARLRGTPHRRRDRLRRSRSARPGRPPDTTVGLPDESRLRGCKQPRRRPRGCRGKPTAPW